MSLAQGIPDAKALWVLVSSCVQGGHLVIVFQCSNGTRHGQPVLHPKRCDEERTVPTARSITVMGKQTDMSARGYVPRNIYCYRHWNSKFMYFSWGTTWCSSLSSMFKSAQVILSFVGHIEWRDAPACLCNKYQTLVFVGLGSTWSSPINCVILAKALFLSGVIFFFSIWAHGRPCGSASQGPSSLNYHTFDFSSPSIYRASLTYTTHRFKCWA